MSYEQSRNDGDNILMQCLRGSNAQSAPQFALRNPAVYYFGSQTKPRRFVKPVAQNLRTIDHPLARQLFNNLIKPQPIQITQKLHIPLPSHKRININTTTSQISRTNPRIDPLTKQMLEFRS